MTSVESKTVINTDGKILFFGLTDFLNNISKGDNCFICGANPNEKEFNNEHIIPDWILNKYNLQNKQITLPNGTFIRYGQYKVQCCKDCNTELGEVYENPISRLLNQPYQEIIKEIKGNPEKVHLLFKWLCLIYIKTHLKDKSLLVERDLRKETGYIADNHYWEDIHHIHCIARSHYTRAIIEANVYGSIFLLPALPLNKHDKFDYMDSHAGKAVLLQLDEFCIVAVLNDACAGYSVYLEQIKKITGPLNTFQLRQIVAELNFININLKERPLFHSIFKSDQEYRITATIPETLYLLEENERIITSGQLLRYYVESMIGDVENKEAILQEISEGKRNYLFNEKGEFNDYSKKN